VRRIARTTKRQQTRGMAAVQSPAMDEFRRFDYRRADVFSEQPLGGNGLTVFELRRSDVPAGLLLRIAQEMRQFESTFVWPTPDPQRWKGRIFTMEEELDFAGHPVIGAACVLHERHAPLADVLELVLELPARQVALTSRRCGLAYTAEMDQGRAEFLGTVPVEAQAELLAAMNLGAADLIDGLPMQVVSTGLPYLIVPLRAGLERMRIVQRGFEALLARCGAKFAYALQVPLLEGRSWDNDGRVEDIATGSAAGPAGAYLVRHGLVPNDGPIVLRQGRLLGRPSEMLVHVSGNASRLRVRVGGAVALVGGGYVDIPRRVMNAFGAA
jgi:PhzF family phenazine biosynthesis protein